MGCYEETQANFRIAKRDTKVPAGYVSCLQKFGVTARFGHGIEDNIISELLLAILPAPAHRRPSLGLHLARALALPLIVELLAFSNRQFHLNQPVL